MYKFIASIILLITLTHAQSIESTSEPLDNVQADSVSVNSSGSSINELKQILNMQLIKDPFTMHLEKQINFSKTDFSNHMQTPPIPLKAAYARSSFDVGKDNLMHAIKMQPKFLSASDLGILGDIFLSINAAAAGYALYMHLKKYGDEY